MKNIFLSFLFILSGLLTAQIKVKDLPTTTTTATGDFLIKDKAAGTPGSTQKITLGNVFNWAITTYSLQTSSPISGLTTNKYTKATSATTIGDALLSDDGADITQSGSGVFISPNVRPTNLTATYIPYADNNKTLQSTTMFYDGDGFHVPDDSRLRVGSGTNRSNIRFQTTGMTLKGSDVTGSYGQLIVSGTTNFGNINFFVNDAGSTKSISSTIQAASGVLAWNVDAGLAAGGFPGITYTTDYSANYTTRSLVDKAYVDGVAGSGISGTGVTGRITKWTGASTIDTSTVLKETGGHLLVTNGSLIKSENGLNNASLGNSQASLESDNGSGSTASVYSGGTAAGALANDGVSLVEFYVDAPNNRARVNTTAGGEITLNSGTGGTTTINTGTLTVNGTAAIIDGNESVGRVFTCTSGTTGEGTWQAPAGLTGATGDLISFSATDTKQNISAVATGYLFGSQGTSTLPAWLQAATLNTSLTTPLLVGSTSGSGTLSLRSTSNATDGNMLFFTDATTERMRIASDGNVSIGTTTADVYGIGSGQFFTVYQPTATVSARNTIVAGTTGAAVFDMGNATIRRVLIGAIDGSHLTFFTNSTNSGTGVTEKMRIESGGNVGIGTSTISARLHVISTTEQQRTGYDVSNYYSATVGSTGGVTFNAVGSGSAFTFSDKIINSLPINMKAYTVATLPAGVQGDEAFVTDATAPTYLGALVGGGAVVCPVFYNGAAWVSH